MLLVDLGLTNRAESWQISAIEVFRLVMTGVPTAMAFSTGKPKPS